MGSLRRRLLAGETLIGGWMQIPHPAVARVLAAAGLDWVAIDGEHGMVDAAAADQLVSAIRAAGAAPLVRLPGNHYADNKRWLDAGTEGLIAPLVRSASEAQRLVESAKYPPLGARGVGFAPCNGYGFDLDASLGSANDETLCCVQIEHVDAILQLAAILAVPGIDAAFLGPYDLSASLGIPGQWDHPSYRAAVDQFRSVCAHHGVAAGIHVIEPQPDQLLARIDEGYRLVAYSLDVTMLGRAARAGVAALRARHGGETA